MILSNQIKYCHFLGHHPQFKAFSHSQVGSTSPLQGSSLSPSPSFPAHTLACAFDGRRAGWAEVCPRDSLVVMRRQAVSAVSSPCLRSGSRDPTVGHTERHVWRSLRAWLTVPCPPGSGQAPPLLKGAPSQGCGGMAPAAFTGLLCARGKRPCPSQASVLCVAPSGFTVPLSSPQSTWNTHSSRWAWHFPNLHQEKQ